MFRLMVMNAAAAIETHRNEINELNVFPVPDGDTGTNMSLTIGAGARALESSAPGALGKAADIAAGALLRGARGNSGVILSLLVRGMARRLKDAETADAAAFAYALAEGVDAAYKAVMKPTEGTILTVSRAAAERAVNIAEDAGDIGAALDGALESGWAALAETVNQNPVLKKANVVDAGGKGYLYILEGMRAALDGRTLEYAPTAESDAQRADFSEFRSDDIVFAYCTEFTAEKKTGRGADGLRDFLEARGDSIVVVEDDDIIKVHVHSNEPGVIITEALTYGPLVAVKIENMRVQHTEKLEDARAASGQERAVPEKKYGAVAVCAGEGMADVFSNLGVDGIITGGQTMNPSTMDILSKIEATPAEIVFVLPNNGNVIMAAHQCEALSEKKVIVIPTRTVPQGIAAMLAFDASACEDTNRAGMTEAAAATRTALITRAARGAVFDGMEIGEGEYIALLEDSLISSGSEFGDVAAEVTGRLKGFKPEFITVFTGRDAREDDADELVRRLSDGIEGAETTKIFGGQPVYSFVIAAE
ncbi:MAG: DAK2 domain-containing protein [Oscillospiraceae bacterium]|jgi:DAK2 domain fusion protein YloV|nr:DAK2 domain-containing protein [Oscillospiraceae bacterium]